MSASFTPHVNPTLLVWTRRTAGFNLAGAAKRLGIAEEILRQWEAGEAAPSIAQLRKASELYKRPLSVFLLPEPPREWNVIHDYRRLPGDKADEGPSSSLLLEIRRAQDRRQIALDILEDGDEPQAFPLHAGLEEDSEVVAQRFRRALGITVAQQEAWEDQNEALRAWIQAVESLGVLIFQASRIPLAEMRGVSLSESPMPAIILNGADSPRGRIFSLLHELAHLALREGAVCLFQDSSATEVFCNRVAGAVLIPRDALHSERITARVRWDDADIRRLARRFGASEEATLRRLVLLGYATEQFYVEKREEYARAYAKWREKLKENKGGPSHTTLALRNAGESFARAVLSAYYERRLTLRDVSAALNVKIKFLPKIEAKLWPRRVTRG